MTESRKDQNAGILEAVEDTRILDPLSEVTRRERKALMLTSLIAFAISAGGLVPKEIKALGITLSQTEQGAIPILMSLSILYLLAGFCIYSLADLRSRNIAISKGRRKISPDLADEMSSYYERIESILDSQEFERLTTDQNSKKFFSISDDIKLANRVRIVGTLRVVFDLFLPIIIGLAAVAFSLFAARGLFIARLIALVTTLVVVGIILVQGNQRRKQILSFIISLRARWYLYRVNRGNKRLKKLDPESAEYIDLQKKLRNMLLKGFTPPTTKPADQKKNTSEFDFDDRY